MANIPCESIRKSHQLLSKDSGPYLPIEPAILGKFSCPIKRKTIKLENYHFLFSVSNLKVHLHVSPILH